MAIARVANRFNSNGTNPGTTSAATINPSATVTAGNLCFVIFGSSGAIISSITDTKGNLWIIRPVLQGNNASTNCVTIAYSLLTASILTTDSITVNYAAGAPGHRIIIVEEWSGPRLAGNNGTNDGEAAAASATVSVTPNLPNEAIMYAVIGSSASAFTAGTIGAVAVDGSVSALDSVVSGQRSMGVQWKFINTSGAKSCTSTAGTTPESVAVSFVAQGAKSLIAPVRPRLYNQLTRWY